MVVIFPSSPTPNKFKQSPTSRHLMKNDKGFLSHWLVPNTMAHCFEICIFGDHFSEALATKSKATKHSFAVEISFYIVSFCIGLNFEVDVLSQTFSGASLRDITGAYAYTNPRYKVPKRKRTKNLCHQSPIHSLAPIRNQSSSNQRVHIHTHNVSVSKLLSLFCEKR